jgi:hypothetical protein
MLIDHLMRATLIPLFLIPLALTGQNPLQTLPKNYQLVFENPVVQVMRVQYGAHEKLPLHNHSEKPTVYVYLTDSGPVRFSHVEEHPFALERRPVKAGTYRVSPGRIEKHTVENLGEIPSEFLRVELKQLPLGFQSSSFRGLKPFDLAMSSHRTEFTSPKFRIERIIAVRGKSITVPAGRNPSLLIAFAPASVGSSNLKRGEVTWIGANSRFVVAATEGSAHILRIVFN